MRSLLRILRFTVFALKENDAVPIREDQAHEISRKRKRGLPWMNYEPETAMHAVYLPGWT